MIDAPLEQVFAYAPDPAHIPEYEPSADEVKDIQRLPDGRYTYIAVSKFLGLHVDFAGEQLEVIPNERIVEKGESALLDLVLDFRIERLEGGKDRVSFVSENTLHGGTWRHMADRWTGLVRPSSPPSWTMAQRSPWRR